MKNIFRLIVAFELLIFATNAVRKKEIHVGAIFNEPLTLSEIAFRSAIRRANSHPDHFEMVPIIKYVSELDSFKTEIAACELISMGIAAIFGPASNITSAIVDSICNTFHIPHIMVHWNIGPIGSYRIRQQPVRQLSINVFPDTDVLAAALADLIQDYDWTSYTIIYDTDDNLIELKDVLGLHGPDNAPIQVVQLDEGDDYRPLLKKIYHTTEPHVIINVENHRILNLLKQAREVKMLDEYKSYIIASLNAHTIDFTEELGEVTSNITSLRMLDLTSDEVTNLAAFMRDEERRLGKSTYATKTEYVKRMQVESVLYHDAVQLFANSLSELYSVEEITPRQLTCDEPTEWEDGMRIANFMKIKEETGISGPLVFDEAGRRTDFRLEVIELYQKKGQPLTWHENGFKTIGTWNAMDKIAYTRTEEELEEQLSDNMSNKTFIVVSRLGAPFLALRKPVEPGEVFEGNARFEGYSLDLIDGIAKHLGWSAYRMELVPDGKYGSYNKHTKQWDGLVKHLLDRRADLAICDLTITHERRKAVDFTMPFMTLGISILYAKPVKQPPEMFSFLSPLSTDVWICTAAAYIGVSILIFTLARMANQEWENPHPCKDDPEEEENIWDMLNSTWFSMGSVMGQGSDLLPKAISTRLVAGMWYFFALIMLASYTANLAAFLTMERMDATIENAEELSKQTKIKYGVLQGGSSEAFFRDSNHSTFKRMYASMESAVPSVFTKSNDEGRDRVLNGKGLYAYLMESTTLEYITERYCTLTQIGGLLDSKGYGIAMPRESKYRKAITGAILKMQEEGKLHQLKTKWWKEKGGGGVCQTASKADDGSSPELGVDNVGGVFLLVAIGIFCGFLIAIFEFLWNVRRVAVKEKMTQWEAFKTEASFAMQIHIRTKPVRGNFSENSVTGSDKSRSPSLED